MMEGLWQFFVLVYYSLATWAFCLLVADNDSIIDGAIDSDKEFVSFLDGKVHDKFTSGATKGEL